MKWSFPLCAVLLSACVDGHRSYHGPVAEPLWRVEHLSARLLMIRDGILYTSAAVAETQQDPYLYAFDIKSGKQLWKSDFVLDYPDSTTIANGVLYVLAYPEGTEKEKTRRLHALDARSGQRLWESKNLVDRLDYVLGAQLGVTAARVSRVLISKTGDESPAMGGPMTVSAAVVDGVAYLQAANAEVRAVTPEQTLWTAHLPGQRFEGPVVAGDNVYFYCVSPEDFKGCQTPTGDILPEWGIYAFHKKTGALRWKWRPEGQRLNGITVDGDAVYVSAWNTAGVALTLDAATGWTQWTRPLQWNGKDHYFRKTYRKPLLFDQKTVVFFDQPTTNLPDFDLDHLDNKELGTVALAYDRVTGAPLWESKLPWKYDSWEAQDGLLFASDGGPNSWRTSNYKHKFDSWFTALDLREGRVLWRSAVRPLSTLSPPLIGDGIVVVTLGRDRGNPDGSVGIMAFRARAEVRN